MPGRGQASKIGGMRTVVLSSKGQVVIPKALRDGLHLSPGDRVRVTAEGSRLVLEREPVANARLVRRRGAG